MTRATCLGRWAAAILLVALAACTGASANPQSAGSEDPESPAGTTSADGTAAPSAPGSADTGAATPGSADSAATGAPTHPSTAEPGADTPDASLAAEPGKPSPLRSTHTPVAIAPVAIAPVRVTSPPPAPLSPGPPGSAHTIELLGAMSSLMGQLAAPAYLAEWAKKLDSGQAPLERYLDELLASPRFSGEVMPSLLFATFVNVRNYYALPSAFVLKHQAAGPMYLRAPCTEDEAVSVHPWWDLHAEVKVCPDSYRPTKWTLAPNEHAYRTAMVLSCDSQVGSPELETNSLCGCGPNLIRCMRDEEQYNEFNRSFMDEIKRTTAYVIEHDLPMASLFTGNATFRDRNVELYYRRQKIGALELPRVKHELADLGAWPDGGKWAPRAEIRPGQHAGVLTAPQILHWLPDRRQRQRGYYEMMWCNLQNSFGATTDKVLEINAHGNNFFVHESWKQLAHTELCMNCHARLDYGSQFFLGYPDSRAGTHFDPALAASGTGPLYGRDLRDLRGEAPLTPQGFANLATEQPDFNSCMTNHFVSYVLGDRATHEDIQAIETVVEHDHTFKAAMKVALERFAARWREDARPAEPSAPAIAPRSEPTTSAPEATAARSVIGAAGSVQVSAALRSKLEQHCTDCHDETAYSDNTDSSDLPFNFKPHELPRALLVSMTDHVAFGMMPKNQALDPQAREDFVSLLIDTLWTDPAARTEASSYYLGRARGLPAHQIDNALASIDHIAHASSDIAWGALERGIWSEQSTITPGFLALTGLEAVRACGRTSAPRTPETRTTALEACLTEAASLKILSRWPAPSTP